MSHPDFNFNAFMQALSTATRAAQVARMRERYEAYKQYLDPVQRQQGEEALTSQLATIKDAEARGEDEG